MEKLETVNTTCTGERVKAHIREAHGEQVLQEELISQIELVKDARVKEEILHKVYSKLFKAFTDDHKGLIDSLDTVSREKAIAETRLRELTIEAYALTGSKKPAEGVGIKMVKEFHYDATKAIHWAADNKFYNCLMLDRRNFESVARGLGSDFIEIVDKPQATIAREL